MNIRKLYEIYCLHPEVTIDSRSCSSGSLFFALKGEHTDGNYFAEDALKNGCSYAIVDNPKITRDHRYILVEDALKLLQALSIEHRKHLPIPVIAITGTNGKTTTKELIVNVLSEKYKVTGTSGNLNNHIGLPLSILKTPFNAEMMVLEMGANHTGEIAELCNIAIPTHGLITNIGKAHLQGFGSMEQIIKTKTALYNFLRENQGTIFYSQENELLKRELTPSDRKISYGVAKESDYRFSRPEANPYLSFIWETSAGKKQVKSHLYGLYNLENVMAAITVGAFFSVPDEKILLAINSYHPDNMRSQIINTGKNKIILDAYNANPTSMEFAIQEFLKQPEEKKALILGDMFELGAQSKKEHEKILRLIKKNRFSPDYVFLAGADFSTLSASFGYHGFADTQGLINYLKKNALLDYLVLIKGSRLMKMEDILSAI